MVDYTIYGQIQKIIIEETRFLKHYQAQVIGNVDPLSRGRVQVICPEIGWSTPDVCPWCAPRQMHAMSVPAIGEWVEIYFISGHPDRPVYLGLDCSVQDSIPSTFDGVPTTHVIFESPNTAKGIVYNEMLDQLDITGTLINIGGSDATNYMVLGTTFLTELIKLNSAMIELQSAINGWVIVPSDGGGALKTKLANFLGLAMMSTANILSTVTKVK